MTKALASIPEDRRLRVATRRLEHGTNTNTRGNGFWAAKDYFDKNGLQYPGKMGAAQAVAKAAKAMQENGNGFHSHGKSELKRFKKDGAGDSRKFDRKKRGKHNHINSMRIRKGGR